MCVIATFFIEAIEVLFSYCRVAIEVIANIFVEKPLLVSLLFGLVFLP